MPIALPIAVSTGSSIPLMVGAVLTGGSLGNNYIYVSHPLNSYKATLLEYYLVNPNNRR